MDDPSQNPNMSRQTQNNAPTDEIPTEDPMCSELQSKIPTSGFRYRRKGAYRRLSKAGGNDEDEWSEPSVNKARIPLLDEHCVAERTRFLPELNYGGGQTLANEKKSSSMLDVTSMKTILLPGSSTDTHTKTSSHRSTTQDHSNNQEEQQVVLEKGGCLPWFGRRK